MFRFLRLFKKESMYKITKLTDGRYWCECVIQDGTERWSEVSKEKAIESMKTSAKVLNHTSIEIKDINFYKEGYVYRDDRIITKVGADEI